MNAKKIALAQRTTKDLLNKLKEESKSWEADGKDAWTVLRKWGGKKLSDGDEIVVARRLSKRFRYSKSG